MSWLLNNHFRLTVFSDHGGIHASSTLLRPPCMLPLILSQVVHGSGVPISFEKWRRAIQMATLGASSTFPTRETV